MAKMAKYDKHGRRTDGTTKDWILRVPHQSGFGYETYEEAVQNAERLARQLEAPIDLFVRIATFEVDSPPVKETVIRHISE